MAEATQAHLNDKSQGGKHDKNEVKSDVRDFAHRLGAEKVKDATEHGGPVGDRLPDMARMAQDKVANTVEQMASVATDKAGRAAEWFKAKADGALGRGDEALATTRDFVRHYPVRTLAAGIAVGAIAGWLLSSRNREVA